MSALPGAFLEITNLQGTDIGRAKKEQKKSSHIPV
jgi:hypothetical protein